MRALRDWAKSIGAGELAATALLLFVGISGLSARADVPACDDDSGQAFGVNNDQVLQWKQSEPSGWKGRANIDGDVIQILPDATGHNHYIVQIGPDAQNDVIEVIYSYEFGGLPDIAVGAEIQACGDFIQSNEQNGPYAASPAGAIIHWLHMDPEHRHPDGFVAVNGVAYGSNNPNQNTRRR